MNVDIFTPVWWQHIAGISIERALGVLLTVIIIVVARYLLRRLIDVSIIPPWTRERLTGYQASRLTTLQDILKNLVGYVLVVVGGIQIIKTIGGDRYDISPIVTTAGVTGIAIGFGAQKLVRDTISGFFILLEDQYSIGDYVTINDVTGTIETVGMRITRIRDELGRLTTLANGDIVKVTNFSRGAYDSYLEIAVGASANLAEAAQALEAASRGLELPGLIGDPDVQGVTSFDAARATLRVLIRTEPREHALVQALLRERLRAALLQAGIPLG